jgi:outer membrane protein, multidrug efflux system
MSRMPTPSVTRPAKRAAVAVALAVLAGCASVGPDYERPPVPLPAAWRGEQPDPADMVNAAWWEAFGDRDLSELIASAIAANKDLLIAARRIEQMSARLDVSQSAVYPQVGYNGVRERVWRSEEQPALLATAKQPNYNNYGVNLTLAWEIDVWGKVARANEAARADLLASEEARRAVMLKVVTGVADSYVKLLARDRQLALAKQVLDNRKATAKLLQGKYEGGSGTLIDATRARAAVEEAQTAIPPIERDIALTENALSELLGRNPGPIQRRALDTLQMPPVPQGVPSDVLYRRPDVMSAEQALVAANARIGVAKSQYFPTISLTSALGLASDQLRWLLARTARTGDIGLGLAGVLFDGGRIDGDVRSAEALRKQMAETYLQSVQVALREVEDSLVTRSKADEQMAALVQRQQTLQNVSKLARQRYEGGQSTYLDVLESERQELLAQDQQIQGMRDRYIALVAVYKAMGGGWMVKQDEPKSARAATDTVAEAPAQPAGKTMELENRQ